MDANTIEQSNVGPPFPPILILPTELENLRSSTARRFHASGFGRARSLAHAFNMSVRHGRVRVPEIGVSHEGGSSYSMDANTIEQSNVGPHFPPILILPTKLEKPTCGNGSTFSRGRLRACSQLRTRF